MKNISMIAAIGKNGELGKDNALLWKIKEDMHFYRTMTLGKNIIMGRKTLESMPVKALKGRHPIILTTRKLENYIDIDTYHSIEELLNHIASSPQEYVVVGGATIYESFMPYAQTMYLTEIDGEKYADAFFPYINYDEWDITQIASYPENDPPYIRSKYVRKKEL